MEDITIRVRGTHTTSVPAESGTVLAQISLEGGDLVSVLAAVTTGQSRLVGLIKELHDKRRGPVTWYAVDQISTYSWTPRDRDGQVFPVRHQASVTAEVKFSDFAVLPIWVRDAVDIDGFQVQRVDWALTAKARAAVEVATRQHAVRDARDRAQSYADALDLGPLRVRALADAGLGFSQPAVGGPESMLDSGYDSGDRARGELAPRNIEVYAAVEGEFVRAS